MRITSVNAHDPRLEGLWEDPVLEVAVDEDVQEISDPIIDIGHTYRLIPCGPFYGVEYYEDDWYDLDDCEGGDYGELNKIGLIKNQLLPVDVYTPDGEVLPLAMEVKRVRRLLRAHGLREWTVTVDEQAALIGLLKWRLELWSPMCYGGASPRQARCKRDPVITVLEKGTHLPVCSEHKQEFEGRMRFGRTRPRMGA